MAEISLLVAKEKIENFALTADDSWMWRGKELLG